MFTALAAAQSLTDRFAWLLDGLCKAIGVDAQKQRMEAALAWVIWNRVRVLGDRLIALAERVRAGRLPRRTKKNPHPNPPPQERGWAAKRTDGRAALPETPLLPREFGWVGRMLPEAAKYAGALRYLLRDPETMALLAKAPQAGRMLRPLCHLLGVQTPEFLRRGAVVGQEASTPVAAEALNTGPRLTPALSTPGAHCARAMGARSKGGEGEEKEAPSGDVVADAAVTNEGAAAPPAAQPPPQSGRSAAEEAALAYARRPGGLYFDGKRMRWS